MKKNNYIIFIIVTLFFLSLAFELQDVQVAGIRFGNSRLSDTTGYIATNRHFKVNGNELITGDLTANGYIYLSDAGSQISFSNSGSTIANGINALYYNSGSAIFSTENAVTELVVIDSATGLNVNYGNLSVDNYTQLGSSSPLIKMKLIKFLSGTAGGASVTSAHGITDWHSIIQWEANIKDEANNVIVNPNSYYTTNQFYAYVDSLNCVVVVPAGGTNLATDTTSFIIWYKY